jgi:DNA-directed RNA polymerase specialized sigma24 family protein
VKARLFTVTHTVTRNLIVDRVRKPHSRRGVVGCTYNDSFSEADPIEAVHHAMVVKPRKLRAGFPTETAA